jgi:hypothetical protein
MYPFFINQLARQRINVTSHRKVTPRSYSKIAPLKPQDHYKVKKKMSIKLKASQLFGFLHSIKFSRHIDNGSFVC